MKWSLAVAMICRFYPAYTLESVRKLSLYQFGMLMGEMNNITSLEQTGKLPDEPVSGDAAKMVARMMLPHKPRESNA